MIITLKRLEGQSEECIEVMVKDFVTADRFINMMAKTAPTKGNGYDKTSFTVEFDNGEVYKGRLDLQNEHTEEDNILQNQIKSFCKYVLKGENPIYAGHKEEAIKFLELV